MAQGSASLARRRPAAAWAPQRWVQYSHARAAASAYSPGGLGVFAAVPAHGFGQAQHRPGLTTRPVSGRAALPVPVSVAHGLGGPGA